MEGIIITLIVGVLALFCTVVKIYRIGREAGYEIGYRAGIAKGTSWQAEKVIRKGK